MALAGLDGVVGIQRSSQTLISFPEWTFCLIPSKINGFSAIMLVQPYEGFEHLFSRKGELRLKYFPRSTRATKESGNWTSLHNCFSNRARLNSWIILNPSPPSSLGKQFLSYVVQWIPLLGGFELHQNCAMALARILHVSSGRTKVEITYVGKARRIDLINTSFPPLVNHLPVHPLTRFCNFSFRKAKYLLFDPLISSGIPR